MIEVISSSHSFFCVTKLVFSRHILTYTKSRDNTLTERRKRTTDSFSPKNLNSLDMSNVILNYIDAQKRKIWDQDLSRKEFL
ncbi:hypothetical protein EfmJHP35_05570 [Enterococcus faecium]|nr:hypothetical protein EfmJHP35_05570 [Enterococcus faecium]